MNQTNNTAFILAFVVVVLLFLLLGGGMATGAMMNGGMMGRGIMGNVSWIWLPPQLGHLWEKVICTRPAESTLA